MKLKGGAGRAKCKLKLEKWNDCEGLMQLLVAGSSPALMMHHHILLWMILH